MVKVLTDYAIDRHYLQLESGDARCVAFLRRVAKRQAKLFAHWMAVGFVHGVMNTGNTTISGETIDYGPAGFLDEFEVRKVFNSIDWQGRYAYINQPPVAQWNLARLTEALLTLGDFKSEFEAVLAEFPAEYKKHHLRLMRRKLGLKNESDGDEVLIEDWLNYLQAGDSAGASRRRTKA